MKTPQNSTPICKNLESDVFCELFYDACSITKVISDRCKKTCNNCEPVKKSLQQEFCDGTMDAYLSAELISQNKVNLKIAGGKQAEKGEIPWIVTYVQEIADIKFMICTGSMISPVVSITAAHCMTLFQVFPEILDTLSGLAGEFDLVNYGETEQKRNVSKVVVHENYDNSTQDNDVALVFVSSGFKFDKQFVRPVCLPSFEESINNHDVDDCLIAGWGETENTKITATIESFLLESYSLMDIKQKLNSLAKNNLAEKYNLVKQLKPVIEKTSILRQARVKVWSKSYCEHRYSWLGFTENMFCAGSDDGMADTCSGDSGGPFTCPDKHGRHVLRGITSWGVGCGEASLPGVYTNVANYVMWIVENSDMKIRDLD